MKKINLILAVFIVALLASCSKSPSSVAETFLSDLQNNKFEDAKKLSTPEAQTIIDGMMKDGSASPEATKWTYKITSEETKGDISTVYFTNTIQGKPELKQSVRLVKSDGDWKVAKLAVEP